MRRNSLFVRTIGVFLFLFLFSLSVFSQIDKVTEGSLFALDAEGRSRGLCPLKQTDVKAEISGFLSRVTVTQTFQNPFSEKIEAVYMFPLPNDAAVDDLTIQIGDRFIRGKIMERQKAEETFAQAKQEGKTVALLNQERPNIFTQAVANLTPGAEIKVVISYIETLKYTDDHYEFTFPMTVGERYIPLPKPDDPASSSETGVPDAAAISPARTELPLHRVSLEVRLDASVSVESLACPTHEIDAQRFSGSRFLVTLKTDGEIPNRDFVLKYKTAGEKIEDAVLTHKDANGGFFSVILQPPDRVFPADATPKEIVFVLDTSGSMNGFPIEKSKEAMMLTLDGLNPQDTFNLITFAGDTNILFPAPVPATPENLQKAKNFLVSRKSDGGTDMMKAIRAALEPTAAPDHVRIVCFMTDGLVGNDFEILGEVKKHPQARIFSFGIGPSINRFLLDELAREGRGEVEYVYPGDDGSAAARRFFERVRNPLLTDISIDWNGLPVAETLPAEIPDLFDTKPVAIVGRYARGARGKIVLHGKMQGRVVRREIDVELPETNAGNDSLAALWARRKVSALMAEDLPGMQTRNLKAGLKEAITKLGLEFGLMTQFTSFVAVDEETVTENGVPRRVEAPVVHSPAVSNLPVSGRQSANYATMSTANSTVTVTGSSVEMSAATTTETREASAQIAGGNGFQAPLSLAGGITQISESPVLEKRGLVSSSGQRPTSNNFTIDGFSANLGLSPGESSLAGNAGQLPALTAAGGTNSMIPASQAQEIAVKTMSPAREQRVAGAEINFVSRGGNNEYHGSLFETFGNEKLNANDFFANSRGLARPPARLNQFGGTLGGFIWKDRAWFSGGYEGLRLRQPGFGVSEVPAFPWRQTAAGSLRTVLNAFPVAGGGLAAPNGFTEFAASFVNPAAHDIFGLRIDVYPYRKLRVGARYGLADSSAALRGDRDFSLNTVRRMEIETRSFSAWALYTPTSTVVVEGRVNFAQNRLGQQFTLDDFGGADVSSTLFSTPDFLKFDFAGKNAALAAGRPIASKVGQFQATGMLEWILSTHQFSFGADFRRLGLDAGAARTEQSVLFARVSPNPNFMTARVNELTRNVSESPESDNLALYAQHGWRFNSRINFTLGLRWDADFAPSIETPAVDFQNASLQMRDNLKNFAPRAGVAYDLFGNGNAVLRGGAGLYYDYGPPAATDAFANSFPFASGRFVRSALFPAAPTDPLRPLLVFADRLETPRVWHVFAEYQQELFRNHVVTATYTSSFGRKLFLTRTLLNADPVYNYARLTENAARSDFNSLQLRFERRFAQGFSLNARYALAKSKDNYSPDELRETNFVSADPSAERGPSDFDVRHQFSIYGVYDIPTFFANGWAKRLAEDWSISAFANARTGFPVNVGYYRVNDFGKEFVRADPVAGVPVHLNEQARRELNPAAFAIRDFTRQGELKRNSLRGFPLFQLDTSLQRRIRFTSEMRLELSASAYNLLNNTNFADMSGNLGTSFSNGTLVPNEYFGRPAATFGSSNFTPFHLYGGARTIQFSAKFVF